MVVISNSCFAAGKGRTKTLYGVFSMCRHHWNIALIELMYAVSLLLDFTLIYPLL